MRTKTNSQSTIANSGTPRTASLPGPTVIGSVDELQALIDRPLHAEFTINGKPVRVECRPLSAATAEKVRALRRLAKPPFNEQRKDYDYLEPKYARDRDENERKARSLMVYTHCPMVAAKQPGLTDIEPIHKFVQGLLSENVLEVISLTIQGGGLDLEDRVNFTSPAASES